MMAEFKSPLVAGKRFSVCSMHPGELVYEGLDSVFVRQGSIGHQDKSPLEYFGVDSSAHSGPCQYRQCLDTLDDMCRPAIGR